jgi:prolipoprotein diacylglyceryltransferase
VKPTWLSWLPDWAWSSSYPHNAVREGVPIPGCAGPNCTMLAIPVFPTSLYESVISLIFFTVLWISRKKILAPVTLFGLFLVFNGIERFLIEKIRVNNRFELLGLHLTQAELISFFLFILGIATIFYYQRRYRKIENDIFIS